MRPRIDRMLLGAALCTGGAAFGQQHCDTELVSRASYGWTGDAQSQAQDISDDGRFVVMNTQARDLFRWRTQDNSFTSFLGGYDRLTGNRFGFEGNIYYSYNAYTIVDPISARITDRNMVAFDSLRDYTGNRYRGYYSGNLVPDDNGFGDIYVRGVDWTGVSRVTIPIVGADTDGPSSHPDIHDVNWGVADVVFDSEATNLVLQDSNGASDVFVRRMTDYTSLPTALVSNGWNGQGQVEPANGASDSPAIARGHGRAVSFRSDASNLVENDDNGVSDVFVVDLDSPQPYASTRVSVGTGGFEANGPSTSSAVSGDGQIVVFRSRATNLVPADTNGAADIFVHYRRYNYTRRVSVSSVGEQANAGSFFPGISSDGRYVVFTSSATNLVPGDTNGAPDAFVHDLLTGVVQRVTVGTDEQELEGISSARGIDYDGRTVAFTSSATNTGWWSDRNGSDDDAFIRVRDCEVTPYCVADFDGNGVVDTRDFVSFLNAWTGSDPRADSNGDLRFDTRDFIAFLNAWSDGCD